MKGLPAALISAFALVGLALIHQGTAAQGLGRLFTTPEERAMLEALRREPPANTQPQVAEEAPLEPEPVTIPGVTVNGIVYRARGNDTVWINGANSYEGDLGSQQVGVGTRDSPRPGVAIRLPRGQPGAMLKPGQTLDTAAGEVTDLYQREPEVKAPDAVR